MRQDGAWLSWVVMGSCDFDEAQAISISNKHGIRLSKSFRVLNRKQVRSTEGGKWC